MASPPEKIVVDLQKVELTESPAIPNWVKLFSNPQEEKITASPPEKIFVDLQKKVELTESPAIPYRVKLLSIPQEEKITVFYIAVLKLEI